MSTSHATGQLHNATLKAIEAKLGRPLRVLHIGNIANNAYNNARIQRQYGIEADVLSYDYYHVMSTPEWEDAEFTGEVDANAPNWWATSLKGWKRPDWFVQGPASGCLQYLRAKHFRYRYVKKLLWGYLEARCLGYVRYMAISEGKRLQPMPPRLALALKAAEYYGVGNGPALPVSGAALAQLRAILRRDVVSVSVTSSTTLLTNPGVPSKVIHTNSGLSNYLTRQCRGFATALYRAVLDALILPGVRDAARQNWLSRCWLVRRISRSQGLDRAGVIAEVDRNEPGIAQLRDLTGDLRMRIRNLAGRALERVCRSLGALLHVASAAEARQLAIYTGSIDTSERDRMFVALFEAERDQFLRLPLEDLNKFIEYYSIFGAQFYDVFGLYDVVQAYSIDGCLCLINGHRRFISYEHGTLRDLPFGNDFYGVTTRISYHASTHIFVTNSDVLPSTERMRLDPARIVCLPHAFDDRKLVAFRDQNADLQPPPGPAVFFSPTRHHWIDTSGSWTKGNDILLRAAGIVAAEGLDFRLILVEWGKEVEASKALIAELGIAEKVTWVGTMQKRELWEAYCRAHAVVDQFTLPALGGVGFETMALGRRLITAIDELQLTRFFGKAPPCLSGSTVDQCAARLRQIIADPEDKAGLGAVAQAWMREYHSAERIVDLQAQTYAEFIGLAVALRLRSPLV